MWYGHEGDAGAFMTPDRHSTDAEWILWLEKMAAHIAAEMRPKDLGIYLANHLQHSANALKD